MKRASHGSHKTRWVAGGAAASVVTLISTGCTFVSEQAAPDVVFSAFTHVHGLGVDSVSGIAYAATHEGVFILPPLDWQTVSVLQLGGPISGRVQDIMAFTLAGGQMYASGHPGLDDSTKGAYPNLGLMTSFDGAATWKTLSLGGDADFHALAVVTNSTGGKRIYGYDATSGTVIISADGGNSWIAGAKLELGGLAADPTQPGVVYATTSEGLAISTDDGFTFALVSGAPELNLVTAWQDSASSGLVGLATDGKVWLKTGNQEWTDTTGVVVGKAETVAYTSLPSPALLVSDRRGIVMSDDLGVSWKVLVAK